jgi:hypothetical protein
MPSDQAVGARAGFWRRFFAMFIDLVIVVMPFEFLPAALFTPTSRSPVASAFSAAQSPTGGTAD